MEICIKDYFSFFNPQDKRKFIINIKTWAYIYPNLHPFLSSLSSPSILYHILNKNDFEKNSTLCTVCTVCSLQSVFLHDHNFHGSFWQYMANRYDGLWSALWFPNRSQSFQRSLLVLWNLDYILSQNNYIPFHTMEILVHNDERTISNSLPCL